MAASCGFLRKASSFLYLRRNCRSILLSTNVSIRPYSSAIGSTEDENFEEMLRNSRFVKLGRPEGKIVAGKITHIVDNGAKKDLYIDFGWKFHAVCTEGRNRARYKHDVCR